MNTKEYKVAIDFQTVYKYVQAESEVEAVRKALHGFELDHRYASELDHWVEVWGTHEVQQDE